MHQRCKKKNSLQSAHTIIKVNTIHFCPTLMGFRLIDCAVFYVTGDGFYRSKDPTNSIKVLKENLQKTNQTTETTQNTHA